MSGSQQLLLTTKKKLVKNMMRDRQTGTCQTGWILVDVGVDRSCGLDVAYFLP